MAAITRGKKQCAKNVEHIRKWPRLAQLIATIKPPPNLWPELLALCYLPRLSFMRPRLWQPNFGRTLADMAFSTIGLRLDTISNRHQTRFVTLRKFNRNQSQNRKVEKMVSLTIEQAKMALQCIESDIEISAHGECDYNDVETLVFYLQRAELAQRLREAIQIQAKG